MDRWNDTHYMQPKGKHAKPQNTNSVKQLSKLTANGTWVVLPVGGGGGALYLRYIRCTTYSGGVNYAETRKPDVTTSISNPFVVVKGLKRQQAAASTNFVGCFLVVLFYFFFSLLLLLC